MEQHCCKAQETKAVYFAYSIYISPNNLGFLKKLQSQTGLSVIHVTWNIRPFLETGALIATTSEERLHFIIDAEYIVTNSFHRTGFFVLFKKPFFVMRDIEFTGERVRLYDFTRDFGLSDQVFGDTSSTICLTVPDFTQADRVLEEQQESSLLFLRENLNAANLAKLEHNNEETIKSRL